MKSMVLFFVLLMSSCSLLDRTTDVIEFQDPIDITELLLKPHLRVLDLGNSYTNDAVAYLPYLVDELDVDISDMCLYKAVREGASFRDWVNMYYGRYSGSFVFKKVVGGLDSGFSNNKDDTYECKQFKKLLNDNNWDLIIIHQLGRYSTSYNEWFGRSTAGYIDELLDIIQKTQPECAIGFLFTHSSESNYPTNEEKSSLERWNKSALAVQRLLEDQMIRFVIPYGTAIQNLRSTDLNTERDLTRDGAHLGHGLARYTAACCYYESLIAPRTGVTVLGKAIKYPVKDNPETSQISVTDENMEVAQKSAVLAQKHPFVCLNPNDFTVDGLLNAKD